MSVFEVRYQKAKTQEDHSIWKNRRTVQNRICFCLVYFTLIGTKTPKCMESSPYGVRKHDKKKKKRKTYLFSVCECVRHQNAKKHKNHAIQGNKTLSKTCLLNVFYLFTYKNAKKKKPAKHPLRRNRITLRKTRILNVFFLTCYAVKHQKT